MKRLSYEGRFCFAAKFARYKLPPILPITSESTTTSEG